MESYGNVILEEWVNLSSMFSCDQDVSHFAHFAGHRLFSGEHDHDLDLQTPSILSGSSNESNSSHSCPIDDQILVNASNHDLKPTFYNSFSQERSNATNCLPYTCQDIFQFCTSETPTENLSHHQSKDVCMMEGDSSNFLFLAQVFADDAMEEFIFLNQDDEDVEKDKMEKVVGQAVPIQESTPMKRKYERFEISNAMEDDESNAEKIDNRKKKTRVARDYKNKKNLSPKNQKMMSATNSNEDETKEKHQNNEKTSNKNNGKGNIAQSFSSSCSEDDSNDSQGLNERPLNVTAKTRASRGAATDPQSIYARKRRERINERLRILQNLVPNGTKVDISTMLEEAVHYVKFLQLQIKLLSSDDMWMYAPIAYNGMDMGLYQNISPNL